MKLLLICLLPALMLATNPGLNLAMKESTLINGLSTFNPQINDFMEHIPLRDIQMNYDNLLISLTNVTISPQITFSRTILEYSEPSEILFYNYKVAALAKFNIGINTGGITHTGTGSVNLVCNQFDFTLSITSVMDSPYVIITDIYTIVKSLTFTSTLGSAINTKVQAALSGDLQNIGTQISLFIGEEIPNINQFLTKYSLLRFFPDINSWIDFSLVGDALVNSEYLIFPLKGEILDDSLAPVYPFNPSYLSPIQPGQEFQLQISDYFTSAYANLMWPKITKSINNLPSDFSLKLTTTGLNTLLPGLKSKYGPNQNISLEISQSSMWPNVTISTAKGVTAVMGAFVGVSVMVNNSWINAANIHAQLKVLAKFSMKNDKATIEITSITPIQYIVANSTIGKINLRKFGKEFTKQLANLVKPFNSRLKNFNVNIPQLDYYIIDEDVLSVATGFMLFQATVAPY